MPPCSMYISEAVSPRINSMSIIYCHKHDRHVDTDYHVDCPEREEEEEVDDLEPTTMESMMDDNSADEY